MGRSYANGSGPQHNSFSNGNGPEAGGDCTADWYAGVTNDRLHTHWWVM